jgi:hypothetical protein
MININNMTNSVTIDASTPQDISADFSYVIRRYEQQGDQLYIEIACPDKPVVISHYFTADEQETDDSKNAVITALIAKLSIMWDNYVPPTPIVDLLADPVTAPTIEMADIATVRTNMVSTQANTATNNMSTSSEVAQ